MSFRFDSIPFVARARPSGVAFSAAFVSGSYNNNQDSFLMPKSFTGVSIGTADSTRRLYVPVWMTRERLRPVTMAVNGGTAVGPIAEIRPGDFRQCLLFAADVPTGTTANFTFANDGGGFDMGVLGFSVIRVVGSHTSLTATSSGGGSPAPVDIATTSGDTMFVLCAGAEQSVTFSPPAGYTAHVQQYLRATAPPDNQPHILLASGTAAGGAPETINVPVSAFQFYSNIALRLRAA